MSGVSYCPGIFLDRSSEILTLWTSFLGPIHSIFNGFCQLIALWQGDYEGYFREDVVGDSRDVCFVRDVI
jgi:hypothetical protein